MAGDGKVGVYIMSIHAKQWVGTEMDLQIKVAGGPVSRRGDTLSLQAKMLAISYAPGDIHFQLSRLKPDHSLGITDRSLKADAALGAAIGIEKIDLHLRVVIATRRRTLVMGGMHSCSVATEQRFEEVAVAEIRPLSATAPELEAAVPPRRRAELLATPILGANAVIGGSTLRILESLVRLGDFLELRLGVGFLAHIRVVLAGQLAVGALDVFLGGALFQSQPGVVILELHCCL